MTKDVEFLQNSLVDTDKTLTGIIEVMSQLSLLIKKNIEILLRATKGM